MIRDGQFYHNVEAKISTVKQLNS